MNKAIAMILAVLLSSVAPAFADDAPVPTTIATDVYSLTLTMRVPQVFDNTKSTGYRKYVTQRIRGEMHVNWQSDGTFTLSFANLVNSNFKVGGANVKYTGYEDRDMFYTRYNYIGSNKTGAFKTPCICFFLELEPSYAIGGNNEDNSFYLMLSGSGSSKFSLYDNWRIARKFSGHVSGTQGCGCSAYTHKSPTRRATFYGGTGGVDDVVATYGKWQAAWKKRIEVSAVLSR